MREREREQAKSERLLLNALPAPIAARLKERLRARFELEDRGEIDVKGRAP